VRTEEPFRWAGLSLASICGTRAVAFKLPRRAALRAGTDLQHLHACVLAVWQLKKPAFYQDILLQHFPSALTFAVHVRALGDPMKLAISVWYEFCHNGVDGGRISRARCVSPVTMHGWECRVWVGCVQRSRFCNSCPGANQMLF